MMSHRAYLFSLRIGHALRESFLHEPYSVQRLWKDVMAGLTVGIIAIPLAMGLAIASGVAPQYGLYTAIIAGLIIPLIGGSRFSISGPTAAFVVILFPIAHRFGLGGLLVAGLMAGVILIVMALLKLGRLIEYIPESVTLGFTSGIAVVIATLQVKDALGFNLSNVPEHYLGKVWQLVQSIPNTQWPSALVALVTFGVMVLWPRLKTVVPAHLPALLLGTLLAITLNSIDAGISIDTIGSRFSYILANGSIGHGIPAILPAFDWPWNQPGPDGVAINWSWQTITDLLPAAFAIAMLGAIESLLCAVVLDGMTNTRHSANSELLGQGIGNVIVPFFGGITATAAIARSAANYKAGAQSPVAGMIHALVVLLGLVALGDVLSYLPMPAMAALLVMVAWNMSEAPKAMHLLKTSSYNEIWVFIVCFSLTVVFDMVIAITVGIVMAALLFMKEIAEMTKVTDITANQRAVPERLAEGWHVFKVSGPLFFAAADRVFGELSTLCDNKTGIILYLDGVPVLDAGGLSALNKFITKCENTGTKVFIADLQRQPLKTLARANVKPIPNVSFFYPTLKKALDNAPHRC
ncbi:MAG: SulP family sulfate permease [Candidatus Azotimanducaceae bacterium]|jgi:SulP family sulfate permease